MRNPSHSISGFLKRGVVFASVLFVLLNSIVPANGQTPKDPPPVNWPDYVFSYVSVMDPKIVEDVFGRRISDRFVAIQVTITNRNSDYQFLVHDVSLDLTKVFGREFSRRLEADGLERCKTCKEACKSRDQSRTQCEIDCAEDCAAPGIKFELSSLELSLVRGVAEKGASQDKRNKILRYLEGAGTVAAAFIGFAGVGPKYSDFMAIYNGDVLSAYRHIYPDFTMNQMSRLSDSAYKSNSLIPKEQAKVIVAFIPQAMFLTPQQRKDFRKDPTLLYPTYTEALADLNKIDFRRTVARIDGNFVVELKNLPLILTGVQIDPDQALNFAKTQPKVKGYILGQFLEGANVSLVNPPAGVQIAPDPDATAEEGKLFFVITANGPVDSATPLSFKVFNKQNSQTISQSVSYTTPMPTLDAPAQPLDQGTVGGSDVTISLHGKNLIPGLTKLLVTGVGDLAATYHVEKSDDNTGPLIAILHMAKAKEGTYTLQIKNGDKIATTTVSFTVKKPTP